MFQNKKIILKQQQILILFVLENGPSETQPASPRIRITILFDGFPFQTTVYCLLGGGCV
jgi:hypothetical protein